MDLKIKSVILEVLCGSVVRDKVLYGTLDIL